MKKASKRSTIQDIANLAQTSVATVSWVLNGHSRKYVSDELKRRVLDAAQALNYRPNLLAQRLRGKARNLLAIIMPQFENIFFNHVVIGAEKYATSRDYKLLICTTEDNSRKELELVNQLIASWVDGILIAPTFEGREAVNAILNSGIPMVILDRKIGENIDYVGTDNYKAAYLGTRYLLEKGHRRIGYIGWDTPLHTLLDRNRAFFDAINDFDLTGDNVMMCKCPRHPDASYASTLEMMKVFKPTALFIDQNTIAEGVVKAIRDMQLKIPEDISVIIFGEPAWAVLNLPEFSCVVLPDYEIGSEGARILIEKLEGHSSKPKSVLLPGRIIERASVKEVLLNLDEKKERRRNGEKTFDGIERKIKLRRSIDEKICQSIIHNDVDIGFDVPGIDQR